MNKKTSKIFMKFDSTKLNNHTVQCELLHNNKNTNMSYN